MTALPPPGESLYILDLSCWVHRFYATTQGRAAHCFLDFLGGIIRNQRPAYFAVCCDLPWPTFRHALAPKREKTGYKANRPPVDAALLERLRWSREMIEDVHGLKIFAERGYEADDCIAALVKHAKADGLHAVLIAHDKDLMQLVDDQCVMWDGKQRVVGIPEVISKFGCPPKQVRDFLAIVGDSADNVPGIKGAGPKAALEILGEFITLDEALACAKTPYDRLFFKQRPRYREMLRTNADLAELSKKLVTLAEDMPLEYSREELRCA